eukprot:1068950-Pelagomonas_calceolata.AAC.3
MEHAEVSRKHSIPTFWLMPHEACTFQLLMRIMTCYSLFSTYRVVLSQFTAHSCLTNWNAFSTLRHVSWHHEDDSENKILTSMERRGEEEMKWEVFYTLTGSSEFSLFLAWGTQRAYNAPQWHPELEPALRDDASLRGLAAILSLRNNRGRCANTHPTSKHISLTRPHVAHSSFTRGGVIEKDKRTRRDTLTLREGMAGRG